MGRPAAFAERLRRRCAALLLGMAAANVPAGETARIALVIDDLGNTLDGGRRTLALPGPVTCAFLPHTPHARDLAERAHGLGKEVMLHLPMQANAEHRLGPGALTLDLDHDAFRRTLARGLGSVPHVAGVNNHMGSLLTRHPGAMQWLMEGLRGRGLYFVDSRTTVHTVAETLARENAVAVRRRDVFLDADPGAEAVRAQFRRLLRLARRNGSALGIGHPRRATLAVLAEQLPLLERRGITLVPASALTHTDRRKPLWHASSSPLPKVAKSSKPSPSSTCCAAPTSKW